jgi:hypothetical protein
MNNEKKIVTWEMFEKYHEQLVKYFTGGDNSILEEIFADEESNEE